MSIEKLNFTVGADGGITFHDFPHAVRNVTFESKKLRQLGGLWLHSVDLEFAITCLKDITTGEPIKASVMQAMWQCAVVNYFKCFSSSKARARFALDENQVFKGTDKGARVHRQLKYLRNKYLVHDEDAFRTISTGAIVNGASSQRKIARVVCVSAHGDSLHSETYTNLRILATTAHAWVVARFNEVCDELAAELEQQDYAKLLAMEEMKLPKPTKDDMARIL